MHVALARHRREGVELLLHAEHVQRRHAHDLGLATLEDRRAVHPREHLDLGGEGADVLEPTAVDADLVAQDALAHELLLHRAEGGRDLGPTTLELLALTGEVGLEAFLELVEAGLTGLLVGDRQGLGCVAGHGLLDRGIGVVLVVQEARELLDRLGRLGRQLGLGLAQDLDELLGGLEALGDDLLGRGGLALVLDQVPGRLGGLGLDHHDRDVVTDDPAGDDHVEGRALDVGELREGDPLAVDQADADATDRAAEGQAGDLGGGAGRVDGEHVVLGVGVERQDGDDDLDLVAQALDEGRAQRAVDEPAGEDRLGRRATLATEEGAGDLARGIHPLLDVHGQREEVEALARVLPGGGGGEEHRVLVQVSGDGAAGLLGQTAGLEPNRAGAEAAVVDGGFGEGDFGSLHGNPPFLLVCRVHRRCAAVAFVFSCCADMPKGGPVRSRPSS